ncbi:MAG: DegV family protein [Enterococcus sp.]
MYKIVTDSCCDLPYTLLQENDVDFISMVVNWDGKDYLDDLGQTFDLTHFYASLQNGALPTTSQVNVGRYMEFFRPYVAQQVPLLYLCFSAGLSGSYQSALQAVALLKEEYPEAVIEVFDTKAASLGEGLMVLDTIKLKQAGKSLTETVAWLQENALSYQHWVTVDDLAHLQRGGRLSKTAAAIGGLLQVKPFLYIDTNGKLAVIGKVRGRKKALLQLATKVVESTANPSEQLILITTSGDVESAEQLKQLILEQITPKEIRIYPMGPTIASHTGIGCLAAITKGPQRS